MNETFFMFYTVWIFFSLYSMLYAIHQIGTINVVFYSLWVGHMGCLWLDQKLDEKFRMMSSILDFAFGSVAIF